ncbi:hypothetical protein LMIY3S_03725 [Labrys miyagiensis]
MKESPRPRYAPGMAYDKALEQLRSRNPTPDPTRWEQAKHDAARFVEKWGDRAQEFGWPDAELFGIDPLAPFARYENMGLVWLLQGRGVDDLTEQFARIGRTRMFRKLREKT